MDAVKTGSIVSLVVGMALLGACGSPSPTRARAATPEPVDSRPVLPRPTLASMEALASATSPPTPVPTPTPGAPPTLAPPPALAPRGGTPSSAPQNPIDGQPSTPAPVASAVIGATRGGWR